MKLIWVFMVNLVVTAVAEGRPDLTAADLPVGPAPAALTFDHFPDRLHAFVWRNWGLAPVDRMALTVGATEGQVAAIGRSMGLPEPRPLDDATRRSLRITIIRRNWHLLPYEQILTLLDISADELSFMLREDDFLFVKLGNLKPRCEPLKYEMPTEETRREAEAIRAIVARDFDAVWRSPGESPLTFVRALSALPPSAKVEAPGPVLRTDREDAPRYLYSYFGSFGDPLAGEGLDPYPDGLLARLAEQGVNGVWLHVVLRQLAPGGDAFPEFGDGHEERLKNLAALAARARKHGIRIYLYMNEPRAMPLSFFETRPELRGPAEGGFAAMCTSDPRVTRWLETAIAYVFRAVPDLGGVFTITASENLTHCGSHGKRADCPRCAGRADADLIAGVNAALLAGVRSSSPMARVIAWDWGWNNHGLASEIIAALPAGVDLMSVSEWNVPIERGGVKTVINEYALSAVGPGPRAKKHWELARARGLGAFAKLQIGVTWEIASVPYLPVLDLVAEHMKNLAREGVTGRMLSWSLGGYPSPNLKVAQLFSDDPNAEPADVLDRIAVERYGEAARDDARRAWSAFSAAFREYPYSGTGVYAGPQQMGPANLLFARPTGYGATMVGLPYDNLDSWRGPYPREVYAAQCRKVADGWARGVADLERAETKVASSPARDTLAADLRVARAAGLHFASMANQARFVIARDRLVGTITSDEDRKRLRGEMSDLLDDEARLARALFALAHVDSRLGFEATNQYFYTPQDLVEKVLNVEDLKSKLSEAP